MPGKLIAFVVFLVIIFTFIGLNAGNSSDVSIWFGEKGMLKDVPIYKSLFVAYLIGVCSVIPFLIGWKRKKKTSRSVDTEKASVKKEKSSVKKKKVQSPESHDSDSEKKDVVERVEALDPNPPAKKKGRRRRSRNPL